MLHLQKYSSATRPKFTNPRRPDFVARTPRDRTCASRRLRRHRDQHSDSRPDALSADSLRSSGRL